MKIETAVLDDVVDGVFAQVREGLIAAQSPLVEDEEVEEGLRDQVRFLLGSAFAELGFVVEPRLDEVDDRGLDVGLIRATQHIHPAESLLAARLLFSASLPGLQRATRDAGHPVSEDALAIALSDQIFRLLTSAALSYVGVLLDRITAVQREERASIARDLHDRVAHTLASGLMKLDLADTRLTRERDRTRTEARGLLDQALGEAQTIAMELRQITGSRSLIDSVQLYLDEAGVHDVAFDVSEGGEPQPLADATRDQVFLIIREALRNSFSHGRPATVGVGLQWGAQALRVEVWDDGSGFSPLRIRPGAMGLVGMRERAELIGATYSLESAPGTGTRVTVEVPYADE
jgi:signal transduction histidine kinase